MDMSKLPKLSGKTDEEGNNPQETGMNPPPPVTGAPPVANVPQPSPPRQVMDYGRPAPEPGGPEAWLSIAIGVILLLIAPGIVTFILHGDPGGVTDASGKPMRYIDSVFFMGDLAVTSFAVVLILEGLVIALIRNPWVILVAWVFTVLTTAGNLLYLVGTYQTYGLALLPAFAVVFGIYIAIYEWRMFNRLRNERAWASQIRLTAKARSDEASNIGSTD
jgi:hypothetical protein